MKLWKVTHLKKSKNNPLKRLNRLIIGLRMEWRDEAPLEHNELNRKNVKVSHRSLASYQAFNIWHKNMQYIANKSVWEWKVIVDNRFLDGNGDEFSDCGTITQSFVLSDSAKIVNDLIVQSIKDVNKEDKGAVFLHSYFTIECLGFPSQIKQEQSGNE